MSRIGEESSYGSSVYFSLAMQDQVKMISINKNTLIESNHVGKIRG